MATKYIGNKSEGLHSLDHVAGAILRNADEIRDLNNTAKSILKVLEEWKK